MQLVMRRIRILIVDDSTVIRRLLSDALASDTELEVAGTAPNGKIALAKIPQVNPDLVTLDMEMPEMDGISTLVELRKIYPKLPVVMFSTLTQRGAESTLDALSKGANDYVTKPANVGSVTAALQNVRNELIPKIKALCPWNKPVVVAAPPTVRRINSTNQLSRSAVPTRINIVTIGVSTGGPNALLKVLSTIPETFPVPIVLVQHMPPIFTKHLADRLNQTCKLRVQEAIAGDVIQAGGVWIAPGDYHLVLERFLSTVRLQVQQGPPENSCRPAVDVLFRSVAEIYGASTLAVVMTGMGQDGLRGCEAVRDVGGTVLIQDEATSVVWGMPAAVSRAGLANHVMPLDGIADKLVQLTQHGRPLRALTKEVGV